MSNAVGADTLGCQRGHIDLGLECVTFHNRMDAEARQRLAATIEEDAFLRWALSGKGEQFLNGFRP
jgi:hypothetical protein